MGQDFFRRIDGYNTNVGGFVAANLAPTNSLTLNLAAGPGRVKGVIIQALYPGVTHFDAAALVITIDGSIIFSDNARDFFNEIGNTNVLGVITSYQYLVTVIETGQARYEYDYESSMSIKITNGTAETKYYTINAMAKVGR